MEIRIPTRSKKPINREELLTSSARKKRSLVSKSGLQFRSIDNFLTESILQNYYPKKNNEDMNLLLSPDDIDEDLKAEIEKTSFNNEIEGSCIIFNFIQNSLFIIEKTLWSRLFGPLKPGSLRGSIFTLMSCALGAGSLALPYAVFAKTGLILGIFLLVLTGLISLYSLYLLMYSSLKTNCMSYSELVDHCFSNVKFFFFKQNFLNFLGDWNFNRTDFHCLYVWGHLRLSNFKYIFSIEI